MARFCALLLRGCPLFGPPSPSPFHSPRVPSTGAFRPSEGFRRTCPPPCPYPPPPPPIPRAVNLAAIVATGIVLPGIAAAELFWERERGLRHQPRPPVVFRVQGKAIR